VPITRRRGKADHPEPMAGRRVSRRGGGIGTQEAARVTP
jgi:hypothetical protein